MNMTNRNGLFVVRKDGLSESAEKWKIICVLFQNFICLKNLICNLPKKYVPKMHLRISGISSLWGSDVVSTKFKLLDRFL